MSVLCTWKKNDFSVAQQVQLEDEDMNVIQEIKKWWMESGENWTNGYYGITELENNGDLVVEDIDDFLEESMNIESEEEVSNDNDEMFTEDIRIQLEKELKEDEERSKNEEVDDFLEDDDEEEDDDDDYDW